MSAWKLSGGSRRMKELRMDVEELTWELMGMLRATRGVKLVDLQQEWPKYCC